MSVKGFLHRLSPLDWVAVGLLLVYVVAFSWMTIRQHESFQTNALDLAKFDQAIWNTAHGRPFEITLIQESVIQSHFSPILAAYAPLYWLWPDIRLLFVVQSICLGGAGFLLYWFFRHAAPWLGLTLYGSYLMHPVLHQVNLVEFRRITSAVFGVSLALYCLFKRRYWAMTLGLAIAVFSKENAAFVLIAVGLYIALVQGVHDVGLTVLLLGVGWMIAVPLVVLPALSAPRYLSDYAGYPLARNYFSYLGHSPTEMLGTLLRDPGAALAYVLRPERLRAVLHLFWPIGFLFLLSPEIALFSLPFLGYLLASASDTMGQLGAWYPAILLPLLYWAAGIGLSRLHGQWRTVACVLLLAAALAGYVTLSELRPGLWPQLDRFQVTDHHRRVEATLKQIPSDAVVAAQDPMVPHLSHRRTIYLFPWFPEETRPDYIVLDRNMGTYPVKRPAYRTLFYDLLSGTEYEIDHQVGSFLVFRHSGAARPDFEVSAQFGDSLTLIGFSPAVALPEKAFSPRTQELPAGSTLRLSLYWRIDQPVEQNYSVFVHATDQDGQLIAQHDSWPADAHRPTSVLPQGTVFRDVHYLTFARDVPDDAVLRVGLYGGAGYRLPTRDGQEFATLSLDEW